MTKRRIFLIIIAAIALLAVLTGVFVIRSRISRTEAALGPASPEINGLQRIRLTLACENYLEQYSKPVNPNQGNYILEIDQNEGVSSVLTKISQGLNIEPEAIRLYWIYTGADRLINPGRYVLNGSLTIPQISDLLTAAGESLVRFAFFS